MTTREVVSCDWLVVGGGIAGISLGYFLAPHGRVVVLEREQQPGYHATGRSAALYLESYGPPQVRALTLASRPFLESPPTGFVDRPILTPRGALTIGTAEQQALLDQRADEIRALGIEAVRLDATAALARVPVLRPEVVAGGLLEPDAMDIDVDLLLQAFLRGMRRAGGLFEPGVEVREARRDGDAWEVTDGRRRWRAPVLVNAAGAWADEVAILAGVPPIGLQPKRRSAFVFAPPEGLDVRSWPAFLAADESFYVKPDAGMLLGSPANADPVAPHDVVAEELDIAIGIDRIQSFTTLEIRRPARTWAGLRSFVADGGLVGGFDPAVPGFFWVAAQGGYGIQTSPAMAGACAALLRGQPLPDPLQRLGLGAHDLSPARLR